MEPTATNAERRPVATSRCLRVHRTTAMPATIPPDCDGDLRGEPAARPIPDVGHQARRPITESDKEPVRHVYIGKKRI
jgi:hypothetical protein